MVDVTDEDRRIAAAVEAQASSEMAAMMVAQYREAFTATKEAENEALRAENERLREEMARRDANEMRNCINWGPCSRHDGSMGDDCPPPRSAPKEPKP